MGRKPPPTHLPLYPEKPSLLLDQARGLPLLGGACRRCDRAEGSPSVGMGAERVPPQPPPTTAKQDTRPGAGQTVLVVSERPGAEEARQGRPFVGPTGALVRRALRAGWAGSAVLDNAVRCAGEDVKPRELEACRPFLATVYGETRPSRILLLGGDAVATVTGRGLPLASVRRGYTHTADGVPVFFIRQPAAGLHNRFVRQGIEEDMAWALSADPPPMDASGRALLVRTEEDARAALAVLRTRRKVTWDVETAGLRYTPSFRILSVGLCGEGDGDAFVWTTEACEPGPARALLLAFLTSESGPAKGGQNIKYDMVSIHAAWGRMPRGISFDTLLRRKILDVEAFARLELLGELVGIGGHKEEADKVRTDRVSLVRDALGREERARQRTAKNATRTLFDLGAPSCSDELRDLGIDKALEPVVRMPGVKHDAWSYALLPENDLVRYNGRDAVTTMRVEEKLSREIDARPAAKHVWNSVVRGLGPAIARVEAWGAFVDMPGLRLFDQYLSHRLTDTERRLKDLLPAGSWESDDKLREYLYQERGFAIPSRTKHGEPQVDAGALTKLLPQCPELSVLLEHRKYDKLRSTYTRGMIPHVASDGRIHPNILPDGARSGRLSCTEPNLQNIPSEKRDEKGQEPLGRMCRDLFIARPGYRLVSADYSQVELRVAAMLSQDAAMIAAFKSGEDFHWRTARLVAQAAWGLSPAAVTKVHRTAAKNIVFGRLYGKTAVTFAAEWGCSVEEAQHVMDLVLGCFPDLRRWSEDKLRETRLSGGAWTYINGQRARWRALEAVGNTSDDQTARALRRTAENGAVNTPVQGTAGDYCNRALVDSVTWLEDDGLPAMLILPIHDALLFEVREDAVDEVARGARDLMEGYDSGGVPLKVEVEVGKSWGSLTEYTIAA